MGLPARKRAGRGMAWADIKNLNLKGRFILTKKNLSIVDAWNWFVNVTDFNILTSSEQLILIHLIKFINKNFWKPVKLEPSILAKSTNKDHRTVKKALTMLINKGFVTKNQEGEYFIGIYKSIQPNTVQKEDRYFNFPDAGENAQSY